MKAALITEEQIKAIEYALDLASDLSTLERINDVYMEALAIVKSLKVQEPVAWWNSTKDSVSTDPSYRKNTECKPLYAKESE